MTRSSLWGIAVLAAVLWETSGCSGDEAPEPMPDGGAVSDSGSAADANEESGRDSGHTDSGSADARIRDASELDAGRTVDATTSDSGDERDAALLETDGGGYDAGPSVYDMGAPALPETVSTEFVDAVDFLYTGADPVQTGVEPETIEADRASVIRGLVHGPDGMPLSGVAVTVLEHAELGATVTRDDGGYDLVVNGGSTLVLDFRKDGYVPSQRAVTVAWEEYVTAPNLILVTYDTAMTAVDLEAMTTTAVAQGNMVEDDDGRRQPALMIEPGTTATYTRRDGSTADLSTLAIRITEYTAGENGVTAMPGPLPATSAYTYAAELSVDEAVTEGVKVNGRDVEFSQPVSFYVDNFLGFEVGTIIPVGYYDNSRGAWVPSSNGRVVQIVGDVDLDGRAEIDPDGTGVPANAERLLELGFTDSERQQLSRLYEPGDELWRTEMEHLSTWDCNLAQRLPSDGEYPPRSAGRRRDPKRPSEDPCAKTGSIIECEARSLGERLPISGTPLFLSYKSSRIRSQTRAELDFDLVTLPPSGLAEVGLEVSIGGLSFSGTYAPSRNLTVTVPWDGTDAYGRPISGWAHGTARIGYSYPASYAAASEGVLVAAFAQFGINVTPVVTREYVTYWREMTFDVDLWTEPRAAFGGWSLSVNHRLAAEEGLLYRGDGTEQSTSLSLRRIVGDGYSSRSTFWGATPAGQPAIGLRYSVMGKIAVGPGGNLLLGHHGGVDSIEDGIATQIAGMEAHTEYEREGRVATAINFWDVEDIAPDSVGGYYIVEGGEQRIDYVDANGLVTMIVTEKERTEPIGDGGPAIDARFLKPVAIARAPDGTLYIADQGASFSGGVDQEDRIRKITPDGIISTIAGAGALRTDGALASETTLGVIEDIALSPDGSLYYADSGHDLVRRIGVDGIVETIAGGGSPLDSVGDDGPATSARLNNPSSVAVSSDGTLFIAERTGRRVRRVDADGVITTFAGTGTYSSSAAPPLYDAPLAYKLMSPEAIAIGPDDTLYIADTGKKTVLTLSAAIGNYQVPNRDGSEVYVFNADNQHTETRNRRGDLMYTFAYGSYGAESLLVSATDYAGNVVEIDREPGSGTPRAIIAPGGARTELILDADGYLASATGPSGEEYAFEYNNGLLEVMTDPTGGVHSFEYDEEGNLTRDEDPSGRVVTLEAGETPDGDESVVFTNGLGGTTTYVVAEGTNGASTRTTTDALGATTTVVDDASGNRTVTSPDGTVIRTEPKHYKQWQGMATYGGTVTIRTPGGKTLVIATTIDASLTDSTDPFSVTTQTTTSTINGGTAYTEVYDAVAGTRTVTMPSGRQYVTTSDSLDRVTDFASTGMAALAVSYATNGALGELVQGPWSAAYGYDASGNRTEVTYAGRSPISLGYDASARLTSGRLPSGDTYRLGYNESGANTHVEMPSGDRHEFAFDDSGNLIGYSPPVTARTVTMSYDDENHLETLTLPESGAIEYDYDPRGRLTTVTSAGGTVTWDYDESVARVASQSWRSSAGLMQTIAYAYDGFLRTGQTWTGSAAGTISYGYDSNLNHSSTTLRYGSTDYNEVYAYNADELLSGIDSYTIGRAGPDGATSSVTDGTATWTYSYDAHGRWTGATLSTPSSTLYAWTRTLDETGRATDQTETTDGTVVARTYSYSLDGALTSSERDGAPYESYLYDVNGNRTSRTVAGDTQTASYDDDDAIIATASDLITINLDGTLSAIGDDVFEYSPRGELLSATVDGTRVVYTYDAMQRRVARTSGAEVDQYFYADTDKPYQLTHSVSPTGLVSRYLYNPQGALFAIVRGGATHYVATDVRGTPRAVFSSGGVAERVVERDSFGVVVSDTAPSFDLPIGYGGGLEDSITGLVRFGVRDYVPTLGRFATRDPIFLGTPQIHPYVYVGNDPVNLIDPTGLFSFGMSEYAGVGGGFSFAMDNDFSHGSICFEVGFGVGGGVSMSPIAGADRSSSTIVAEVGAACGPISFGVGAKLDDCGTLTIKGGGGLAPFTEEVSASYADGEWTAGFDAAIAGGSAGDYNKNLVDVMLPEGSWKCQAQGKVAGQVCKRLW